ncbi:FAD/NAD(P)-binding domain-containing protein [Plenodomus tracheiphilus IPT5]|uniref:FAD/NAD(P)-binding domain-containing protein n=1 Tax=Plenodomus tracheiphilus IPT5 TaxID=1408161 RepID=A0A6A7BL34_9PLEO|nr:FAD/NAD(P)-binding domain-containing protein [Plenodomus tracheiphilus IPT5]
MAASILATGSKAPLNVLIVGAGVCGPAFALMLMKSNPSHNITIIERSASLRTGGQQIDLNNQSISIINKLGLLDAIRAFCVKESGMEIVDKNGKSIMQFGIKAAGAKQGPTLTQEFEFMRGDLVNLFVTETEKERQKAEQSGLKKGSLTYLFNTTITVLSPSTKTPGVNVTFSSSHATHYDLVVAADGQGSRTRKLAFGEEINTPAFNSLNIHAAFYNIPRQPTETSLARVYMGPNRRLYLIRTGNRPKTQIYQFLVNASPEESSYMKKTYRHPLAEQKAAWTALFMGAGWETPRFLKGMETTEDFYACEIGQVKMPGQVLHKDRVVLVGDAGYCPSPFTGMGTTLSLIGAYVLAGELGRSGASVEEALERYQEIMKTPVEECQKLTPGFRGGIYPTSAWGIWVVNSLLWGMACLRVDKVLGWVAGFFPDAKMAWKLPEYEEVMSEERGG